MTISRTSTNATVIPLKPQRPAVPGSRIPRPQAYVNDAHTYEMRTEPFQVWRRALVGRLPLQARDTVLDVGCGTGLCLPLVRPRVGATGQVVGVDESPQMLSQARRRVVDNGWHNITLIESPIERAPIPVTADAALFCAVHDIMRSFDALQNVFTHLRPGAWVAACGGKWAAPWLIGLNMVTYTVHRPFVRSFEGFDRPWSLLQEFVDDLQVYEVAFGSGYLAVGRAKQTG